MNRQQANDCALCDVAANRPSLHDDVNANVILARKDTFLMAPALGPLVPGHVIVISAEHSESLRFLPTRLRSDYAAFSGELRSYCAQIGDTMLEAEHGASNESLEGPCIRHAHVHILPGLGEMISIFDEDSQLKIVDVGRVSSRVDPYLWIANGASERLYHAPKAPGQQIRRAIGIRLAIDDWDWAINPKAATIVQTIEYWSDLQSTKS